MNIKKLEEEFNLNAEKTNELIEKTDKDLKTIENSKLKEDIFSFEYLKEDYINVRDNLRKLINVGQKILEQASSLEIFDLNAGQLMALAQLQDSVGKNLDLLINIYKKLSEIKNNMEKEKIVEKQNQVNIQNANIIQANTNDILKILEGKNENK